MLEDVIKHVQSVCEMRILFQYYNKCIINWDGFMYKQNITMPGIENIFEQENSITFFKDNFPYIYFNNLYFYNID